MIAAADIVDLELDGGAAEVAVRGPVLVVARRGGVPVGAVVVEAAVTERRQLLERLVRRPDEPPPRGAGVLALTVAVCTRDRPELLARCLASVRGAVSSATGEVEVDLLVVDNGSGDERTERAALAAGARYEYEAVPGLNVARNRAVAAFTGSVIAFVDDDVVVDQTWLRTLARVLAAHPGAAAVSGNVLALRLDTPARREFERTTGFSLGWSPLRFEAGASEDLPFRPGLGVGCNMALRRSALERIGAFDEALDTGRPLPGGGDLDIMIRAVLDGGVVYDPSVVVFHEHRREWSALRYQFYTWGKGWAAVLDKWHRGVPEHRRRIRGVARYTARTWLADLVRGPRRTGRYRRWHCVLLLVGFVTGWLGTYRRSVTRMERRRRDAPPGAPWRPVDASGA